MFARFNTFHDLFDALVVQDRQLGPVLLPRRVNWVAVSQRSGSGGCRAWVYPVAPIASTHQIHCGKKAVPISPSFQYSLREGEWQADIQLCLLAAFPLPR